MKNYQSPLQKLNKFTIKIAGFIMALSYIPQIWQMWSTGSSDGISLAFMAMVTAALAMFLLDAYVIYRETGEKKTFVAQLMNFIPAVVATISILVLR